MRSIILQPREVRGVLSGYKKQLRRPYKPVPAIGLLSGEEDVQELNRLGAAQFCPFTQHSHRLSVRESLSFTDGGWRYAADKMPVTVWPGREKELSPPVVSSSRMPWWASRIRIEASKVELQRLHQVEGNPSDAAEEMGWEPITPDTVDFWRDPSDQSWARHPDEALPAWWDEIYGKTAPYASNPVVWCLWFKREVL